MLAYRMAQLPKPSEWPHCRLSEVRLRQLSLTPLAEYIDDLELNGLRSGRVVWSADHRNTRLGIAWDWDEIAPNVLVIHNPLALETNIDIERSDGNLALPFDVIRSLNVVIYSLPWQSALRSRMAGFGGVPPESSAS